MNRTKIPPKITRRKRRHKADEGDCGYCDKMRDEDIDFHPSHDASPNCESGQRHHCTCDWCF